MGLCIFAIIFNMLLFLITFKSVIISYTKQATLEKYASTYIFTKLQIRTYTYNSLRNFRSFYANYTVIYCKLT